MGRDLATTVPRKEDADGRIVNCEVRIGLFAFCRDVLVFPYIKRKKKKSGVDGGYDWHQKDDVDAELAVAIVSDADDDPFCPLPLHVWTHNLGAGTDSAEWRRFERIWTLSQIHGADAA